MIMEYVKNIEICWTTSFLLKNFSNNGCIDMVSPQYEFLDACQNYSKMKKLSHTGCIDMVSPHCESAFEYQEQSSMKKILHNESI